MGKTANVLLTGLLVGCLSSFARADSAPPTVQSTRFETTYGVVHRERSGQYLSLLLYNLVYGGAAIAAQPVSGAGIGQLGAVMTHGQEILP